MKYVIGRKCDYVAYDTYEKAEEQAKRYVADRGNGPVSPVPTDQAGS